MLTAVIPDPHPPFHCARSTRYLHNWLDQNRKSVGHVVLLGDVADLHALSTHRREPQWEDNLAKELDAVRSWLAALRSHAPKAEITYIKGNHEDRWDRTIQGRIPAMRLLGLSLAQALQLDDMGIRWHDCGTRKPVRVPCGQGQVVQCWHGHEVKGSSKTPAGHAMKIARLTGANTHIGHTHRWGQAVTMSGGKPVFAIEGGFMGDRRKPGFAYAGPVPEWQTAFHVYDSEATDSPLGKAFFPK